MTLGRLGGWSWLLGLVCLAASGGGIADDRLTVGIREVPPFVIRNADGSLEGLSIDLWRELARELKIDYRFRETDLADLVDDLSRGTLDISVAALTVTADREGLIDFTHPFYSSGLAIAVPHQRLELAAIFKALFSWRFLQAIGGLVLVLGLVGSLIWWFERRKNPRQFDGGVGRGIGSGFWWAAVTMTTVGYGDKAPVTAAGRMLAVIWMFISVITISGFTAAIASVFTLQQLHSAIRGPQDLATLTVAVVGDSTSAVYAEQHGLQSMAYAEPAFALRALTEGSVDAVVFDAPVLRYLARRQFPGKIDVLPGTFMRQDYAFALPTGSDLREPLNRALLSNIAGPEWKSTVTSYLGGE